MGAYDAPVEGTTVEEIGKSAFLSAVPKAFELADDNLKQLFSRRGFNPIAIHVSEGHQIALAAAGQAAIFDDLAIVLAFKRLQHFIRAEIGIACAKLNDNGHCY